MQKFQLKRRIFYESFTAPIGRICAKIGIKPNSLSVISLLCCLAAGIFFWQSMLLMGVLMIIATFFFDMLDGATARASNLCTAFGGFLDDVFDRYGEAFILIGISISGRVHPVWGTFALFGMIIASYTRKTAEATGKVEHVAVGIVGRLDKLVIISIGAFLEHFFPGNHLLTYTLILVGITSYITSVQRLLYAKKVLNSKEDD